MDASIASSGPIVQPIPRPTGHQRLQFARWLANTRRITDFPGEFDGRCTCLPCQAVAYRTGRGAMPAGFGSKADHVLNANWRLSIARGDATRARFFRQRWNELAGRVASFYDGFEPDPEAA